MIFLKIHKSQTSKNKSAGRNNQGHIVTKFRGSGCAISDYIINFRKQIQGRQGIVLGFRRDSKSHRKCRLALIYVQKIGVFFYTLASSKLKLWDRITIGGDDGKEVVGTGSSGLLKNFPNNSRIFNVEIRPNNGGQIARAAGTHARILRRYVDKAGRNLVRLELPSGRNYIVSGRCYATLGDASSLSFRFHKYRKAGDLRHMNHRPRVRGVAMNPVDHPHGGGEGKTSGGRISVSQWGILTKGWKTNRSKLDRIRRKKTEKVKKKKKKKRKKNV